MPRSAPGITANSARPTCSAPSSADRLLARTPIARSSANSLRRSRVETTACTVNAMTAKPGARYRTSSSTRRSPPRNGSAWRAAAVRAVVVTAPSAGCASAAAAVRALSPLPSHQNAGSSWSAPTNVSALES